MRQKRKRYRKKKKKKLWELKHSVISTDYTTNTALPLPPEVASASTSCSADRLKTSLSVTPDSYSKPALQPSSPEVASTFTVVTTWSGGEMRGAKTGIENFGLRKKILQYEEQALEHFENQKKIVLPDNMASVDRERILSHVSEIQCSKKRAYLKSQMLARKCDLLEHRCMQLRKDKEHVRNFWKNKVLYGHTRGGQILMSSLRA